MGQSHTRKAKDFDLSNSMAVLSSLAITVSRPFAFGHGTAQKQRSPKLEFGFPPIVPKSPKAKVRKQPDTTSGRRATPATPAVIFANWLRSPGLFICYLRFSICSYRTLRPCYGFVTAQPTKSLGITDVVTVLRLCDPPHSPPLRVRRSTFKVRSSLT